jgi:hypothetical protein
MHSIPSPLLHSFRSVAAARLRSPFAVKLLLCGLIVRYQMCVWRDATAGLKADRSLATSGNTRRVRRITVPCRGLPRYRTLLYNGAIAWLVPF